MTWIEIVLTVLLSVAANLLTPFTRTALFRALGSVKFVVRAFGRWGYRKQCELMEKELALLTEYHADPLKLTLALGGHFCFSLFLLWLLVFGFGFARMFGYLSDPRIETAFFALLGVSTQPFFTIFGLWTMIDKLRDFDAYRQRAERRLVIFRNALDERGPRRSDDGSIA